MNLYTFGRSAVHTVANETIGIAAETVEEAIAIRDAEFGVIKGHPFIQLSVRNITPGLVFYKVE